MTPHMQGRTAATAATGAAHRSDVARGERFEFGCNWRRFLDTLTEARIGAAEASLLRMLGLPSLEGLSFLDVGSGSGLFSLAARRLGARVHSFDYDPQSVACARELHRRYFAGDERWTIDEASVLDAAYIRSLGRFDIVYSWGVLHHTGRMWEALAHTTGAVAPGGRLFVAIYNDTGTQSARWRWIKRTYNRLPAFLRVPFTLIVIAPAELKAAVRSVLALRPGDYLRSWRRYDERRGMHRWRDIVDWVGGYPYEVARPEEIFDFCQARGFTLMRLRCGNVGLGCNEFVFVNQPAAAPAPAGAAAGRPAERIADAVSRR